MPKLTVTIITLNEAEHIGAAIESAAWADQVLVVDSGSSDATAEIARAKGATLLTRRWAGYVDQKNFAADAAAHDWIFSLDADERIPSALADEIRGLLAQEPSRRGYRVPRVTFHLGRWIRTTDFYPDYQTRLYDRRSGRWRGKYVHESVTVNGGVGALTSELQHYSYRDLADQVARINLYSTLAARQMYEAGRRTTTIEVLMHPPAAFLRNYVLRRGFLDGTVGLIVSAMNAYSVFLKFAKLQEIQRMPTTPSPTFTSPLPASNAQEPIANVTLATPDPEGESEAG